MDNTKTIVTKKIAKGTIGFLLFLLIITSGLLSASTSLNIDIFVTPGYEIKNVILFIGDGVGNNHYKTADVEINADFKGFVNTNARFGVTTDSAAAATAMATGKKVNNARIGGHKNISEIICEYGKSVGIITTDKIYGATPAGFSAHAGNRSDSLGIMQSQMSSAIKLFMGQEGEYVYEDPRFITHQSPTLKFLVEYALDYLSADSNSFFLMAECSKTDTFSHRNDIMNMITELLDFKEAIDYALDWAKDRKDTAIIITSDHETGGLKAGNAQPQNNWYTSGGHTPAPVPIYTYSFKLNKTNIDNTQIFEIIHSLIA